MIPYLAWT